MSLKNITVDSDTFIGMCKYIAGIGLHCFYFLRNEEEQKKLGISEEDKKLLSASIIALEKLDKFCEDKFKELTGEDMNEIISKDESKGAINE